MSPKRKLNKNTAEQEIDRIVVEQANDESAWEKPVRVQRNKSTSLSIPADLAARAAFLARVHRIQNVDDWLTRVLRERIELEEAAFAGAKEDLAHKTVLSG